jgi:hypothetical protein
MRRINVLVLAVAFALQTAPPPAFAAQGTATLSGTARSSSGQMIVNCTAQLRSLQTGRLVGSTTCDSAGGFIFTGLNPGSFVVEIVNAQGLVVASSAVTDLAAGATATLSVTAATGFAATSGGIGTAVILTSFAAAAGVAGVVVVANRATASPSQ